MSSAKWQFCLGLNVLEMFVKHRPKRSALDEYTLSGYHNIRQPGFKLSKQETDVVAWSACYIILNPKRRIYPSMGWTISGWSDSFVSVRRQDIACDSADFLSIKTEWFSHKKVYWKISQAKYQPFDPDSIFQVHVCVIHAKFCSWYKGLTYSSVQSSATRNQK